jgi:hypothetical protein
MLSTGVFHGERFCLQITWYRTSCSRLQKLSARRVCRRLQFCKRVRRRRSGGAGGPSWVSMRFGHGDGATNRATVARYRSCCLADFSAAPLVGCSEEGFCGWAYPRLTTTERHRGLTRGTLHTTRATSNSCGATMPPRPPARARSLRSANQSFAAISLPKTRIASLTRSCDGPPGWRMRRTR